MPTPLTGYAPPQQALLGQTASAYDGMKPDDILKRLYTQGFDQAGVNALYAARGLSNPPTVPDSFIGGRQGVGRDTKLYGADGAVIKNGGDARDFLNTVGRQTVDPYRGTFDSLSSAGSSVGQAVKFEVDRAGNLVKSVAHDPSRLLTGVDPASTGLWNGVLGTDNRPLVGQLGGATEHDFQDYERRNGEGSLGPARGFSQAADYLAGSIGAGGAMHGLGEAFNGVSGTTAGTNAGTQDLGVFSNGGKGGMAGVGGGDAGALAARGGITGGAGTGVAGSLGGGSGLLSQANIGRAGQLHDLLGNNQGQQGGGMALPFPVLGNQQQPQQQQMPPPLIGLPTNTQMPFIPTRGYRERKFNGATIWS